MGNTESSQGNGRPGQRNSRRAQPDEDYSGLAAGIIGGVALVGAAAAAIGYLATRDSESPSNNRPSQRRRSSSDDLPWNTGYHLSRNSFEITRTIPEIRASIAADARPTCGGGVLVLPSQRKIFFYTLDWSSVLEFQATPDQFELVNAYIAMELWEDTLKSAGVTAVTIKVDNTIFNRSESKDEFWNRIESFRLKIGGDWEYVRSEDHEDDDQHDAADKLSRKKEVYWNALYPEYSYTNHDSKAISILAYLTYNELIPPKFRKGSPFMF